MLGIVGRLHVVPDHGLSYPTRALRFTAQWLVCSGRRAPPGQSWTRNCLLLLRHLVLRLGLEIAGVMPLVQLARELASKYG